MNIQAITDKTAISLSLLCTAHCLLLPLLLVYLPSLSLLFLESEQFHFWLVFAVLPTSIIALTIGCKKHKRYQVMLAGIIGIILLIGAILGENFLGEAWEKGLTLLGSTIIAFGHFQNYQLCKEKKSCHCD